MKLKIVTLSLCCLYAFSPLSLQAMAKPDPKKIELTAADKRRLNRFFTTGKIYLRTLSEMSDAQIRSSEMSGAWHENAGLDDIQPNIDKEKADLTKQYLMDQFSQETPERQASFEDALRKQIARVHTIGIDKGHEKFLTTMLENVRKVRGTTGFYYDVLALSRDEKIFWAAIIGAGCYVGYKLYKSCGRCKGTHNQETKPEYAGE